MGVGLAPLDAPGLVARAFGEPIPPPRVPFAGMIPRRRPNPNWRDQQLRDWGNVQELPQVVQQLQQQDLQRQELQLEQRQQQLHLEQRQQQLEQRRARHREMLFGVRDEEGAAARPAVVMRRIVRGGEDGDGDEALLRGHGIDLVEVVGGLLMDGGGRGGVRFEFGGGGAVTEEMKKEAQMLREKDERCA